MSKKNFTKVNPLMIARKPINNIEMNELIINSLGFWVNYIKFCKKLYDLYIVFLIYWKLWKNEEWNWYSSIGKKEKEMCR